MGARMKPVSNWRTVIRKAWSVRFMILGLVFIGLEAALPLLHGVLPVGPGVFAALTGLSIAGAFVSRIVMQKDLSK